MVALSDPKRISLDGQASSVECLLESFCFPVFFRSREHCMARAAHLSQYEERFVRLGAKPGHIRRIWRAWLGDGPWTTPESARFPRALSAELDAVREELESLVRFEARESRQADSAKLLVHLADGQYVEAVLLPRQALCISTQVGCAVGCVFCMTGRCGLVRQLSSAEIVAQVVAARRVRSDIKKVVFMGMGEPSHNLDAVEEAVRFLGDVAGFAHKQIVVSTVGDERLFDRLHAMSVHPALALSLHTTDNEKRARLLPRAARLSVERLLERTLDYAEATKYPAQIEWTLMAGVNDSAAEVERLAELVRGRYAMVNFIAVNPVDGSPYTRPDSEHIEDLITILRRAGVVATLRDSAAQDIEGGCGQLRAKHLARSAPAVSTPVKGEEA